MPPRKKLIKVNADTYVDENDFFARAKTPDSLKVRGAARRRSCRCFLKNFHF